MKERILQANLNNLGGAFSVAYEAQKKLIDEYVFDYFFPDAFVKNAVYEELMRMGSKCVGEISCSNRFLKQFIIYKTLFQYLNDNDYKFIHIHSDTAWKIAVYYLAAKKAGINNIVVHSHSSGINGHYRTVNYLLHLLCRPIIKKAKYRCACSDVAAEWMFGTTKNVTIIQNGVDIDKFKFNEEKRKQIRKQYCLADDIKVVGSVSDFSYQKNPEFIFKLIKHFQKRNDYVFLLVGNREGCKLKKWVEADKGIKNVIFVGQVTYVEAYLSAMDTFILPSRFEGLPMCALEAQVNGIYTIISDKVTAETENSKYFSRLRLDEKIWVDEIINADITHNRSAMKEFLKEEKTTSLGTAEGFRKIYKGRS